MAANRISSETRARLLSAATELFAERGFHGTTVREIALRARANVAAANYHFGSKEALYLGVLRTQFAEVRKRIEQRGVHLVAAELDRLGRAALVERLRSRLTTMLEFLLGPPPALHGPLMIREMTDPSEALPVIVSEFIEPQIEELGALLERLEPNLQRSEVESCVHSMIGQVMFYSLTRPVQLLIRGRREYPRNIARQLGDHITDFSLGGMKRLAEERSRPSVRAERRLDAKRKRARRNETGTSPSRAAARSMAPALVVLVLCLTAGLCAVGCASWNSFARPEGDGGWDVARRRDEVGQIGRAAGVAVDGVAPQPEGAAGGSGSGKAPAAAESPDGHADSKELPTSGSRLPSRVGASESAKASLDLPTALALAAHGNRRIAEADQELAATAERVLDVRGRLLPQTNASARYTWYTDAQTTKVVLPPGLLPPGTQPPVVAVRDTENGVVNGTVAIPIDVTGELWHTLKAAQAGYRGERARVWAVTLEQQLDVVRAYFDLLEALRLREVAEETAKVYRTQVGIADDRYKNGRLTKNDLLTFQVALSNAEQAIIQRDLQIERARWALNDAIGADVNHAVDPVDVRARPRVPSAEEALRLTYENNPVLASLLEEQQRLDESVTALVRSRLPRVQGGGAVDYQSSGLLQPPQFGSGFVGMTWDLGTDLRRESQIAAARIDAERNRVATERQMRELEAAVRTAQLAAIERLTAYSTAESAVGQAEENLRIRQQQFDVGRAQSDDVLIAENLLSSQRATLASALYQAHTRRAELQRLIGLPIETE